jgi:hypothetical protein
MKQRISVELHINDSSPHVLSKIRAATEREILPFVSASRYPQQREKEFVSHVSGNRVRIWRVPSSTRSRQNICYPCLLAQVRDVNNGSDLIGSFALHPFSATMVLIPLIIVLPMWLWFEKTPKNIIGFSVLTAAALCAILVITGAVKRLLPKEQSDILNFLGTLFPDAVSLNSVDKGGDS